MTTGRIVELLENYICYERKKAAEAAVEGDSVWAVVHTYGELLLTRIIDKIKLEDGNE